MRSKIMLALAITWAISIILLGTARPTYLVEKAMEVSGLEFSSKEAYVLAVERVQWARWLYFGSLIFLTVHLVQRQRSRR